MRKHEQVLYTPLFLTIIALFILTPIISGLHLPRIVGPIFFFILGYVTLWTLNVSRKIILGFLGFFVISFFIDEGTTLDLFFTDCGHAVLWSFATYILAKRIFQENKITGDTIRGGIAVYFLLGICFALIYRIVFEINPNAFTFNSSIPNPVSSLFYFSITTLTTLGYGDITPRNQLACLLTNLEAIIGQLYIAILIARLVGIHIAQKTIDNASSR